MPPRACLALAPLLLALGSPTAPAQDKKADGAKEKAAAVENLKKINLDKATLVVTDNFVVASTLPEAKVKALGATLEKTLALARKAAKYEAKESAWAGKLVVYFLPDGDDYKSFMRRVLQKPPEGMLADFRAEPPFVVDPAALPGKPTDADLYARTAALVAGEHLRAKGTGTQVVPEWLRDGFGRVVAMRVEGTTTKRYREYKTAARNAVRGGAVSIGTAGEDAKSAAGQALANSVAEYLAFGPPAANFGKFIEALRPGEQNANPTLQSGLQALGWRDEAAADAAWKRWVLGR